MITDNKLPRRSFLTGAASVLGAASVGLAPRVSQAAERPSVTPSDGVLSAYFWDGSRFVSVAEAASMPEDADRIRVGIFEIGHSDAHRTVDALLPGGMFHAYCSGPNGIGRASFDAPECPSEGMAFIVSDAGVSHEFKLASRGTVSQYLILDSRTDVRSLFLVDGARPAVHDVRGAPTASPGVLIRLVAS
jgi:hypothetical protein